MWLHIAHFIVGDTSYFICIFSIETNSRLIDDIHVGMLKVLKFLTAWATVMGQTKARESDFSFMKKVYLEFLFYKRKEAQILK